MKRTRIEAKKLRGDSGLGCDKGFRDYNSCAQHAEEC